jgi:CHAD domain-containing protein
MQGRPHVTGGHLEVETKYDVDDGFLVPELTGLAGVTSVDPPVEHALEAVYFDTADLRLLRARVTVRRRTGGPDAGWHLKLPAGTARRELHAPLGRATKKAPPALLEPVAGVLRGAVPSPVATLRTRRVVTLLRGPGGEVLAEVADDSVTATLPPTAAGQPIEVHGWREVEVELGVGDATLGAAVGERLIGAGARPSTAASKIGRALGDRLAPVALSGRPGEPANAGEFVLAALADQVAGLQEADLLLRTEQSGGVHRIRIAARRLRRTFASFRHVLDRAVTDPLREELSWLGTELAGARDDDVGLEHLRGVLAAEPEELVLGPVAARLQQAQLKQVQAGRDRAFRTLSAPRYLALVNALYGLLADPPLTAGAQNPVGPVLRAATRRSVRTLRRRLDAALDARDTEPGGALHAVHKAARQLRHTAEIGRGEVADMKKVVRVAKRAQTVLGEHQDTVVTRELCRRLGVVAAAAGENAFTYGRLHALEQARADRTERDFWKLAPKLRAVVHAG